MQISVNKSPRQFITGEDNLGLLDWLRALDIPPSCIVVEITEGLLMNDRAEVQQKLLAFRDAGIQSRSTILAPAIRPRPICNASTSTT